MRLWEEKEEVKRAELACRCCLSPFTLLEALLHQLWARASGRSTEIPDGREQNQTGLLHVRIKQVLWIT